MSRRRIFDRDRRRRRRIWLNLVVAALIAILAVAGATTSFAADRLGVRAGLHAGYGRMAFDLPNGIGHRVAIDGTRLTIEFDRPVQADLAPLRRMLADFVGTVTLADERRIEATLTRSYALRDFLHEGALVVDLMTAGAKDAVSGLRVGVRVGEHPTFTRLVFDWPSTVDYSVASESGTARIRFRRPAEIAVPAAVIAAAPRLASLVAVPPAGGETEVQLGFEGRIRHFRDGFKVVVDVLDAPKLAVRADAVPSEAEAAPVAAKAPPAPSGQPVPALGKPIVLAPAQPAPDAAPVEEAPANQAAAPAVDDATTPEAAATEPAADAAPVAGASPGGSAPAENATPGPLQLLPAVLQAAPAEVRPPAAFPEGVETLHIEIQAELDGALIRFPFRDETGAAVFRRGGHLWLVFDRVYKVDAARIAEGAREFVQEVEQLPDPRATVVRIVTIPGYNALTARDGNRWEVVLAPQLLKPEAAMGIETHLGTSPSVSVGPTEPSAVLRIADPAVGDEIRVATVRKAGDGVAQRRQFADFHLLTSIQGVAVIPLSDRVELSAGQKRLIVSAVGGLRLTDAAARARVLAAGRGDGFERFFDFAAWRHAEIGDFDDAERGLLARVGTADDETRNAARLELARFYLSHGLADRALGIIDLIAAADPEQARIPTFLALRGAARYVIGNQPGAERDLFERELDGEAEILLWRAAVRGVEGDYVSGSLGLQQAERFVQDYPDALRKRFAFLGAELSLARNDPVGTEFWLEVVKGVPLTLAEQERMRVYRAGIAAKDGQTDTAVQIYDRVIKGRDRLSRALATLHKVDLQLDEEAITPAEAVEMLDRLRYVWRGDGLEFRILRRLGELEVAAGKHRAGLATLKRAAANFPEHPGAPEIADDMRAIFRDLYLEGGADALSPVTAIALFEEFRELVPAGSQGDEMVHRLADRLVAVDLLEKAAGLLQHQVEYRLEGPVKGEVGGRLAMIHLLDRQPGKALAALAASDVGGLAPDIVAARTLVAARAHALLGDHARALASIGSMTDEDADRLRAEIFWRQQNWDRAAALFARLAGPVPAEGALSDERARFVMNRAVALALEGANGELAALNREFSAAMAPTPFAADFQAISQVDGAARNLTDVLQRVAVVDDFKAFMDSYRARLAKGAKSTTGS